MSAVVSKLSLSLSLFLSRCVPFNVLLYIRRMVSSHGTAAVVGRYAMSTANVQGVRISVIYYIIFPLNLTFSYNIISITADIIVIIIIIIIFIVRV